MTRTAPNQTTMFGWLILVLVAVAGFLVFKARRPQLATVAKKRLGTNTRNL
jgi:hypothetical protein